MSSIKITLIAYPWQKFIGGLVLLLRYTYIGSLCRTSSVYLCKTPHQGQLIT